MLNQDIVYPVCSKLFVEYMTFGDWLRDQIKTKNLSNAEVARRAGVSGTYIGNLVRDFSPNTKTGKARPSEDVIEKIVRAIGGDLNEARLAAGYAPVTGNDASESAVEIEDIKIILQGGQRLSKRQQREILDTAALVARGVIARGEAENEGEAEE